MPPGQPQPVEGALTSAAIFIVLTVKEGGENIAVVRDFCSDLSSLIRAVGFRSAGAGLTCVMGLGSGFWDRMMPGPRPKALHVFREINGVHHAPSTPGDLMFHIRASSPGFCFELAARIMDRLKGAVVVRDETHGFKYFDNRDLLGFVDGTENPTGQARAAAALIGAEDPDFAGGSYVIVQKYLHDLDKWNALSVETQEKAVGRYKLSDIEMPDDVKPTHAHNALTSITDDDGNALKIIRDNMPFGNVTSGEFGTYFIGYACDPARTERMLDNMFIGNPPGNYDRLLDVSTAATGTLFFVPTVDFLDDMPAAAASGPPAAATPPGVATGDGSLGLGSLKNKEI